MEHDEQKALFIWAKIYEERFPQFQMLFAVPNGGFRKLKTARDLKAEGVKAGVPDVLYPVPRRIGEVGYAGLAIEMKFGKNKTTPEQEWWLGMLQVNGWRTGICYSWRDAARLIADYEGISWEKVGLGDID
jgi:hypothetical protein